VAGALAAGLLRAGDVGQIAAGVAAELRALRIGELAGRAGRRAARRIHGELAGLGVRVSASTVWEILNPPYLLLLVPPVHTIPGITIQRGQALRSVHRSAQLAHQYRHLRSLRLAGYWAQRRQKVKPPLDSCTVRLLSRQDGRCMAFFGVRVVSEDGSYTSGRQAVIRTLALPLSLLLLGLGFVGILVGDRRRALHDVIAGTAVIYSWDARAARLRFLSRG
jgi:hypothetical protein